MSDAPAPVDVGNAPAPVAGIDPSDALNARVAEKRDRAESGLPTGRGPDGKFLGKQPATTNPDASKAETKAETKSESKPSEDVEKLKAETAKEIAKRDARVAELEARDSEWEETAERAYAHIEALEAVIAKLQAGAFDERDEKLIALERDARARALAEERRANGEKSKAEQAKAAEHEAAVASLKTGIARIVAEHPSLAPGAAMDDAAKQWWKLVMQAHEDPHRGPAAALELATQYAPTFGTAIKSKQKPASPQARTLAKHGGTGGGAARDLSPEGIREKYTPRLAR